MEMRVYVRGFMLFTFATLLMAHPWNNDRSVTAAKRVGKDSPVRLKQSFQNLTRHQKLLQLYKSNSVLEDILRRKTLEEEWRKKKLREKVITKYLIRLIKRASKIQRPSRAKIQELRLALEAGTEQLHKFIVESPSSFFNKTDHYINEIISATKILVKIIPYRELRKTLIIIRRKPESMKYYLEKTRRMKVTVEEVQSTVYFCWFLLKELELLKPNSGLQELRDRLIDVRDQIYRFVDSPYFIYKTDAIIDDILLMTVPLLGVMPFDEIRDLVNNFRKEPLLIPEFLDFVRLNLNGKKEDVDAFVDLVEAVLNSIFHFLERVVENNTLNWTSITYL